MSAQLLHTSISVQPTVQLLNQVHHLCMSQYHGNTCSGVIKSWEFVLVQVKQRIKVLPLHGTTLAKTIFPLKTQSLLIQESAIFMYQSLR